jgi:hypothetical protein
MEEIFCSETVRQLSTYTTWRYISEDVSLRNTMWENRKPWMGVSILRRDGRWTKSKNPLIRNYNGFCTSVDNNRLCGLVVRVPGCRTEMYCVSCEVRTEFIYVMQKKVDRLCGLVVRILGYRSESPGSIPGATRFCEKWWAWNGAHLASWVQLRNFLKQKVAAPV